MSVRFKIALTVLLAGLLTAVGVVVSMVLAFQRFEYESASMRAHAFLQRVARQHPELLEVHRRTPDQVNIFLRNLVLYEPDVRLYLLDSTGDILAASDDLRATHARRVPLGPVHQAAGDSPMPYVMGDDPADPSRQVIVAAWPLHQQAIRPTATADGFLYLVCQPMPVSRARLNTLLGSLAEPGLVMVLLVVSAMTLLAAWVIATITRPLTRLTQAVATVTQEGLQGASRQGASTAIASLPDTGAPDEFGQLARGMDAMLKTLQSQWATLQRLDQFRREGVSNLSHDLRSPLTATAACLETLQNHWNRPGSDAGNRELVTVALRNTHNAARLVRSLGDLAQLDEPTFTLQTSALDLGELLGDVVMRFASRAEARCIDLVAEESSGPVVAEVDNELIERALANLVDNALKFCAAGDRIALGAAVRGSDRVLSVCDTGPGIALGDQPHLFDRFYQSRQSTAPAMGEGGKGLGLAIVKRIAELHGGTVTLESDAGRGTCVTLVLPGIQGSNPL